MRIRALFFTIFTLLGSSGCKYLEAPAMGLAKEMCSCLFVSKMSEDYCRSITKEARIIANYDVNWYEKTVKADGNEYHALGVYNEERPRLGCLLQKVEHRPEYPGQDRRN